MYLFGLISGLIILALIFHDTFEVMVLPRQVRRKLRFITLLFRYTWQLWSWIAEHYRAGYWIVMTEKDAVRWVSAQAPRNLLVNAYALRMELMLSSGQSVWQKMIKHLSVRSA